MPFTRKQRKAAAAGASGNSAAASEQRLPPPPGVTENTMILDNNFYTGDTGPTKPYSPAIAAEIQSWITTYKTKAVAQAVHELRTIVLHVHQFQSGTEQNGGFTQDEYYV